MGVGSVGEGLAVFVLVILLVGGVGLVGVAGGMEGEGRMRVGFAGEEEKACRASTCSNSLLALRASAL